MRWAGKVARKGVQKKCILGFSGETWGQKSPLGRPRRRWKDNIKTDLQEMGWGHELD